MQSPETLNRYDVVITGAGLGGLLCAVLLAKEGMRVCVLEKNRQIGGCLQTFAFRKKVFDSSVHYIGGLGEGHTLNRIFKYAGIMDRLQLQALDENGFDKIAFGDNGTMYPQAIGGNNFIAQLLPHFPKEKDALESYLSIISTVTKRFPLYHLRNGDPNDKAIVAGLEINEVLKEITANDRLRNVLAGNNLLYAGVPGKTPFYLHALVLESYLHSAHKVVPGSSEISKQLWKELQKHGGELIRNTGVKRLVEKYGLLDFAETEDGNRFYGRQFISAIHPAVFLPMVEGSMLRPAYRSRISSLEQTPSALMLNVVLKTAKIPYRNYNIYWHPEGKVFPENGSWPKTKCFFFTKDRSAPEFADTVTILEYSDIRLFEKWKETHNSIALGQIRDSEYLALKEEIALKILGKAFELLPELKGNIEGYSLATPLSYRDYTGTPNGSLYGVQKDVNQPANTIATRTKIPNLLLTGQNINLHGVLGVSITALATCAELVGLDYLLGKINNQTDC